MENNNVKITEIFELNKEIKVKLTYLEEQNPNNALYNNGWLHNQRIFKNIKIFKNNVCITESYSLKDFGNIVKSLSEINTKILTTMRIKNIEEEKI